MNETVVCTSSTTERDVSAQQKRANAFKLLRVGPLIKETIVVDGFGRYLADANQEQRSLLDAAGSSSVSLTSIGVGSVARSGDTAVERSQKLAQRLRNAIPADWREAAAVRRLFDEEPAYLRTLAARIADEYRNKPGSIFPPKNDVFRALALTPLANVRAVIVGQDPYVGQGQADGLAFSVRPFTAVPPSLRNVLHEMGVRDIDRCGGDLSLLARAGVLLLNRSLTVERGKPRSHAPPEIDWHRLTDALLRAVAEQHAERGVCVMLWGRDARATEPLFRSVDSATHHLVLTASHPSPKSADRGFLGCRHFQQCDEWLAQRANNDDDARIFARFVATIQQ